MRRAHLGRALTVVGASLATAAVVVVVIALRAQRHAPQPPPSAASPVAVMPQPSTTSGTHPTQTTPPTLPRSVPVHLSIPAIGVESDLEQIGLDSAGQIQTPPLARDSHAYWLTVSPTPGQVGPAVIIGHVDSAAYGPAVFFRLGAMRQREQIAVSRADGSVAVFEVQRVVEYAKSTFPTFAVYGNTDNAALRLITCGGTFNSATHNYESNIVVYAALVGVRRS